MKKDDFTFAPHDKPIVIMKDDEMRFMAMPETIIRLSMEHEDMSKYLETVESDAFAL